MYNKQRLGEVLIQFQKVTTAQVDAALKAQADKDARIGELLVEMGACTDADVAEAIAYQLDYPFETEFKAEEVDLQLLDGLNLGFCRNNCALPLRKRGRYAEVLTDDPLDVEVLDEMRMILSSEIIPLVAPRRQLIEVINAAFELKSRQLDDGIGKFDPEEDSPGAEEEASEIIDIIEGSDDDDEAPVIRFVNSLFVQAVRNRASDIHIEPGEKEIRVRFRVDGVLKEMASPPKRFHSSIVTRIKIEADLNIAEKRIPQDGRIRFRMAGRDIDVRVATAPTAHGERITMRLLDKSAVLLNVRDIGFMPDQLDTLLRMIHRPHGIVLVTGPTGSGKTTTLYSCLSEINSPDKNIMTIEDPVEYQLAGISQMQVNEKIDLSFATGLRSYLRHDPDVIMVGEIRDGETAEMAIKASLTGHLVFSTLHTNDSAGAFTRLIDMGVEPFLVASTVNAALAQRLVRRLCPECKVPYRPSQDVLAEVGLTYKHLDESTQSGVIYRPREGGCDNCNQSGYRGRAGIYELLIVNESITQLIINRSDAGAIKRESRKHGMRTLRGDGALKVLKGVTSIAEVLRVTAESHTSVDTDAGQAHG